MKQIINTLIHLSNLTHGEFAKKVNTSQTNLSRLKHSRNLNIKTLTRWMRIVQVPELIVKIDDKCTLIIKA